MNGNNTTNTIEKTGWGIIKWTIISVVTLGFLGTIFWVLLYSNFTANFAYVIPIRNRYNKVFPQNLTFQIQGTKAGSYIYAFTGKLIAVDLNNRTISLSGSDSKVYIFKLSDGLIDTDDPSLLR